eukprot:428641_1
MNADLTADELTASLNALTQPQIATYDAKVESCLTEFDLDAFADPTDLSFDFILIRILNDLALWNVPRWYRTYYLKKRRQELLGDNHDVSSSDDNVMNPNNNNNNNTTDRMFLFRFFAADQNCEDIADEFNTFFRTETFDVTNRCQCCMCTENDAISAFEREMSICQSCLYGLLSRMANGKGFDANEIKLLNIFYTPYELPFTTSILASNRLMWMRQKLGYFIEQYITKKILFNNFFSCYATNPPLYVMKRGSDKNLVCFKKNAFINALNCIKWTALSWYTWRANGKPMIKEDVKDLCVDSGKNIVSLKHNAAERLIYQPYGDAGLLTQPGIYNLWTPSSFCEKFEQVKSRKQLSLECDSVGCSNDDCICHEYYEAKDLWDENTDDEKEIYDKQWAIFTKLPPYLMIKNAICQDEEALTHSFIGKISHLLAKPEEKPGTGSVVTSIQGTGKGTTFTFISLLNGTHNSVKCSSISAAKEKFNDQFLQKTIVLFDEVDDKESKKEYNFIKGFITDTEQRQEVKYGAVDYVNVFQRIFFFSNNDQCIPIKLSDRR